MPAESMRQRRFIQCDVFTAVPTRGNGLAVVYGTLVENLHVAEAKRHLAHYEAIAALEAGAIERPIDPALK